MLTLYDSLSSGNGYKARLILTLTSRPFRRVELDLDRGETRTPEFLALNPDGRIPLLVFADGRRLAQSNAILWHLAEGTPWLPEDAFARAKVLEWLFFEQYSHEPAIAVLRFWATHPVTLRPDQEGARPHLHARGLAALGVMETRLATAAFLVDDRPSIADLALYAYTHVAPEGGFDLDPFPGIRAWCQRIAALPGIVPITDPIA